MMQVEAMKALGVKRILGLTYFGDATNRKCAEYLTDAGFEVLAINDSGSWTGVDSLSPEEMYALAKGEFLKNKSAQGIWIPGGGGGGAALKAARMLEEDLGVSVVTNTNSKLWAFEKRLYIRQPIKGYGRLLEEMP